MRLVLLHGHDSSPARLDALADGLRRLLEDVEVHVPAGPCAVSDATFAWWADEGVDGEVDAALAALRAATLLEDAIVIGFSQGGALALAAAMSPIDAVRAAVCAGGFLPPGIEVVADAPPLLLLHADDDEVVDVFYAESLERVSRKLGVDVELQTYPGGHVWSDDAPERIAAWIRSLDER